MREYLSFEIILLVLLCELWTSKQVLTLNRLIRHFCNWILDSHHEFWFRKAQAQQLSLASDAVASMIFLYLTESFGLPWQACWLWWPWWWWCEVCPLKRCCRLAFDIVRWLIYGDCFFVCWCSCWCSCWCGCFCFLCILSSCHLTLVGFWVSTTFYFRFD